MIPAKSLATCSGIASATSPSLIRVRAWHVTEELRNLAAEWIAFLDSDDVWEIDKIEWQLKALSQFAPQCYACYTDVRFLNHPETRTMFQMVEHEHKHEGIMGMSPNVMERLVRPGGAGMVVCLSSFMARADMVRKTGEFNRKLLFSQDSEFMFRLAMLTSFCYVNRPLVGFDRSPAELRHVGVQSEWNHLDFLLRDSQLRLEGLSNLAENLPTTVRRIIREQLGSIRQRVGELVPGGPRVRGRRESRCRERHNLT